MVATLRESQADLARLIELASQGEDVVITVDGKPKAKLTRTQVSRTDGGLGLRPAELAEWLNELEDLRRRYSTGKTGLTVEQILDEDRADRV